MKCGISTNGIVAPLNTTSWSCRNAAMSASSPAQLSPSFDSSTRYWSFRLLTWSISSRGRLLAGGAAQRRLGNPERVGEQRGVLAQLAAQRVDRLDDRLGPGGGELAVLLVPATLGLDARQRVEAAELVEDLAQACVLAAPDGGVERLEHDEVDPGTGRVDHVVLAVDEDAERVAAGVDAALQPARRALEDVLLAPAEERALRLAVEQLPALVAAGAHLVGEAADHLADRGALGHRPEDLAGEELRHAERVELAELVLVVGEEVLRRELEQDGVVALEGGEDVGVGLEVGEAIGAQVAGTTARLAAGLDRLGGLPGGDGLDAGGQRLKLPPLAVVDVGAGEHL